MKKILSFLAVPVLVLCGCLLAMHLDRPSAVSPSDGWTMCAVQYGEPKVYVFEQYGLWGLADKDKQVLLPPVYADIRSFSGGNYSVCAMYDYSEEPVVFSDNPEYPLVYGVINRAGEIVVPFRYDGIEELPSGLYRVRQDGLYGLLDADARVLIEPKYGTIGDFVNGFAIVRENTDHVVEIGEPVVPVCGLIDESGRELLPTEYSSMQWDGSVLDAWKDGAPERWETAGDVLEPVK